MPQDFRKARVIAQRVEKRFNSEQRPEDFIRPVEFGKGFILFAESGQEDDGFLSRQVRQLLFSGYCSQKSLPATLRKALAYQCRILSITN